MMLQRSFLLLCLCLLQTSCDTLKLALETTAPDGNAVYASSNVNLFDYEGDSFYTALGIKVGAKDTLFAISVSSNKKSEKSLFKKGDRMTITLGDRSEVVLKNMLNSYYEVENDLVLKSTPVHGVAYGYYYTPWIGLVSAIPYEVAGYVPRPSVEKHTSSYALYLISCQQFHEVLDKGVTDLELESNERKYKMGKPEDAGGIYAQLYTFLLEQLGKKR